MTSKLKRRRSSVFLVISTFIILTAGTLTVLWQMQHRATTRADAGDIVGSPTLPAATVNQILADTPMAGTGQVIAQAASNAHIDDAFALGVWYVETNDGAAGVGLNDLNPGSVRGSAGYPAAYDGYTIYPSYTAAITDWFNVLHERYVSEGYTSVYTICHPYVGTSSALLWAGKVVNLMDIYHAEAPAPTPTPSPTPIPSSYIRHHAQIDAIDNSAAHPVPDTYQEPERATVQQQLQQASTTAALSPKSELYLTTLALLAALVIALAAVLVRRRAPLFTPALAPATAPLATGAFNFSMLPPLYVNEYSPISGPTTAPLPAFAPELDPVLVPSRAVPVSTGTGLLTRYSQTDAVRPRRVLLRPAQSEQPPARHAVSAERNTEGLSPYRAGMSLPGRVPERVEASSGGLLRRFGDMSDKK